MDIVMDREADGPLYFLLLHALSPFAILNYEATNTGQVGRLQPHSQTRTRRVMTKRPVTFYSLSLSSCVAWKMDFVQQCNIQKQISHCRIVNICDILFRQLCSLTLFHSLDCCFNVPIPRYHGKVASLCFRTILERGLSIVTYLEPRVLG